MLFIAPVGDILRAIFLDNSINTRRFYVQVFAQPLFVPNKYVVFTLGWRLGGGSHTWNLDSPSLLPDLAASIKREAIPYLSNFGSVQAFVEAVSKDKRTGNLRIQEVIAYALTREGRMAEAVPILDRLIKELAHDENPWKREIADTARSLMSAIEAGPEHAQLKLDSWKADTKKNIGLDGFA